MKKALGIMLIFIFIFTFTLNTAVVYAEPAIISTLDGAEGAQDTWDGNHAKEADGNGLKLYYQGDAYGFFFDNVPAGVYKIAFYINADSICNGKRLRVSPRVNANGSEMRCWIDWSTTYTLQILSDALDDEKGKFILVSVINVPADDASIDVGFWQDTGAYIGTLDKIVLATADYDFKDNEYVLIDEKSYGDNVFTEDPGRLLLADEDSWTTSTSYADAVSELGPVATESPIASATPAVEATPTPVVTPSGTPTSPNADNDDATPAPTATANAASAPTSSGDTGATKAGILPVWAIFVIVIVLAIAAGIGAAALSMRKKEKK